MRCFDATLGQQLFDISEPQWEPQVEPNRVADDHLRETAAVRRGRAREYRGNRLATRRIEGVPKLLPIWGVTKPS